MCDDTTIKELLPAYREQALDQTGNLLVENHLASCDECRTELSLLRMMAEETVPDPGEAFWNAMPDRIYQAVQKPQPKKKIFDLSWLFDRIALPRWAWAAATAGTVLIISWLVFTPLQNKPETPRSQGDEYAGVTVAAGSVSVADLDQDELSTIDSWTGSELGAIAQEAEPVIGTGRDADIYEAFEDLNAREVERLSNMLVQFVEEG
jgi:anti-sigma factor RsiW